MRISIITQNLGEESKANFDLSEFLENPASANPDVYVEFSQEDGRKVNGSPLCESTILEDKGYTLLAQESINGKTQASQNIISSVFINGQVPAKVLSTGRIAISPQANTFGKIKLLGSFLASSLHTGKGYTKGVVYIKLKVGSSKILLLNMHLPVLTKPKNGPPKDPTLGFEYRRESFEYLLGEIQKLNLIDSSTTVLIGGDLNFRQDEYGLDQLNVLLKAKKGYKSKFARTIKELPFPNGSTKRITCKFRNPIQRCRTRNMPNTGFTQNFIKKTQEECGNSLRTPSRCDRFLLLSDEPVSVTYHQSEFIHRESDHNAVLATLDFKQRPERAHVSNILKPSM